MQTFDIVYFLMNLLQVPMSPRNPPCLETVAPVQKCSLPVSSKTKFCSNRELRPMEVSRVCFSFFYLSFQLEKEFFKQIVENGVAATVSQDLKEKLRKVAFPAGI